MTKVEITRSKLDDLATAISAKSGEPLPLTIAQMQSAVENIPTSTPTLQTKTASYTPIASQQTETISADSGYDGLDSVSITVNAMPSGTEGTPSATKGTVSNHSVSVTPSVTNAQGYISGGTHTGTAVSVSASELVSGTLNITTNNTYDVTNYASAVVNVSGGGGGGASNFVTGTFTGTDAQKGTALNITLPYTGSGYPIAVVICPTEGAYNSTSGSFYNLIQRYAIAQYTMTKSRIDVAPTYDSGANNQGVVASVYKSSTNSATSYSRASAMSQNIYVTSSAISSSTLAARFKSNTEMSVYIASDNYGFVAGIEYTYHVIYSE